MEWISVKDRLPESYVDVLLYFLAANAMSVGAMTYQDGTEHWACNVGEWYTDADAAPDFWMPLPNPPEGE